MPCCLTYDDTISLGNVKDKSVEQVLYKNKFLEDLRKKGSNKHLTCQKCFGEPTKRRRF